MEGSHGWVFNPLRIVDLPRRGSKADSHTLEPDHLPQLPAGGEEVEEVSGSGETSQLVACVRCSNGPLKVYHIGGPCPYGLEAEILRGLSKLLAEQEDRRFGEVTDDA